MDKLLQKVISELSVICQQTGFKPSATTMTQWSDSGPIKSFCDENIEIVDHQFTKQRNSTFPYYLLKTSWCFAKEGTAEVLESFGFLDFRYCHFAAITRVDINVGSSLRTEKDWFFKNAQQITQRENQPDEDELIILLLETKAEQGSRNLLPVDVV